MYKLKHPLFKMRILRHDNHLLWFSVVAIIGIVMYCAFSYGNRTAQTTTTESTRTATITETDDTTTSPFQEQIEETQQEDTRSSRRVRFDTDVKKEAAAEAETVVRTEPTFVYLDLAKQDFLKEPFTGRVVIQLRPDVAPRTCANFVKLCEEKKYVNTPFHRVIKDFMLQGGDIVHQDGTGSYSVYGGEGSTFDDESFLLNHDQAGVLSMANSGPNTNGSQFFITTQATPHLDGKHVVFGKVVQGIEHIHDIEREMTDANNAPIRKCYILNCGVMDVGELQTNTRATTVGHTTPPAPSTIQQPTTTQTAPNPMPPLLGQHSQPFDQAVVPLIEPSPFSL